MDNNVNLNYDRVKDEFVNFLRDSGKTIQWSASNPSEINIFDCSEEFMEYLDSKYSDVDILNFSKMMENISEMRLENGKLVTVSDTAEVEDEDEEDDEDNNSFGIDYLNDLLDDEDFIEYIDKNHNGVEKEEILEFLNSMKQEKSDNEDVTLSDIIGKIGDIKTNSTQGKNNTSTIAPPTSNISTDGAVHINPDGTMTYMGNTYDAQGNPTTPQGGGVSPSLSTTSTGGSTGIPTLSNTSYNYTPTSADTAQSQDYSSMGISDLEGIQADYSNKMNAANSKMQEVKNKSNDKVDGANTALKTAADDYKNALMATDGANEEGSIQQQICAKIDEITASDEKIADFDDQIATKTETITTKTQEKQEKQTELNGVNTDIATKQAQLNKMSPEDEGYTTLQREISTLQAQANRIKEAIGRLDEAIKQAQEELSSLEEQKAQEEQTREGLIAEKENLEAELDIAIQKQIEDAKSAFDSAQTTYQEVYSTEFDVAQAEFNSYKTELVEINRVLEEKRTQEQERIAKAGLMPQTAEELAAYGLREKDISDWQNNNFTDEFKEAYVQLANYAKDVLGVDLSVVSGYRSYEEQAYLYATLPAGQAARPGSSQHEYGNAVDLHVDGYNSSNPSDPVFKALGEYWESMGYTWGGRFTAVCEPWHFDTRHK